MEGSLRETIDNHLNTEYASPLLFLSLLYLLFFNET